MLAVIVNLPKMHIPPWYWFSPGLDMVAGTLLGQSVGFADGGVQVDGQGSIAGPAPAAQARASNRRLTRSSWRTWPQRKLRRKVPRVDGALTTQPMAQAVPPVRNTSASSMQSPPGRRPPGSSACRRCWLGPGHRPGPGAPVPVEASPGAGPGWPEGSVRRATRRWSSKVIRMRSG